MTIDDAVARFPDTTAAEWTVLDGGAVAHKSATIGPLCKIRGPAMFRGGTFLDGTFWGGEFRGGTFWGGEFWGGTFLGRRVLGRHVLARHVLGRHVLGRRVLGRHVLGRHVPGRHVPGRHVLGRRVLGGTFLDGTFRRGEFRGGEFRGGEFWGGTFWDGIFLETPFQVFGFLPWNVNVSAPQTLDIGCESHTMDEWDKTLPAIAASYRVSDGLLAKIKLVISLAEQSIFPKSPKESTDDLVRTY